MDSVLKYENLVDYSIYLKNSIKKIDDKLWTLKPSRQTKNLTITLRNIEEILSNIKRIRETREKMRSLPSLDKIAKEENNSARKAFDQMSAIKEELRDSYLKLQDEFEKNMTIASKQCSEVERTISDKDERKKFFDATRDFKMLVFEVENHKSRIPFAERDELNKVLHESMKEEHKEKENEINSITDFRLEDINKLQLALSELSGILALTPDSNLSEEVRNEVAEIKRALPPKAVTVTRENLEKLRHSSHLILDLEQINDILKTTYSFTGKHGKLQKINKRFEALGPLLEQAIKTEREKNADIRHDQDSLQSKMNYATDAVKTYSSILGSNKELEQEQIRIDNETHGLHKENERLKQEERTSSEPLDKFKKIKENKDYMDQKKKEKPVGELPREYTDMKDKLQNINMAYREELLQGKNHTYGGL